MVLAAVVNLFPIPTLNGFNLLVYCKEWIFGKGNQEPILFVLTLLGFVYLLVVTGRAFIADYYWLTS